MKKSITYAVLPAIALALLGAGAVSAQGMGVGGSIRGGGPEGGFFIFNNADPGEFASHQTQMFTSQAELTGLSVDEIKEAWAQGKNLDELLTEKGIDPETIRAKMKTAHEEKMKEQIQSLVTKGVITQAQADKRIEFMKNHKPDPRGNKMHRFSNRAETTRGAAEVSS
ncbi:MAG TPA: hypothetical protein PK295_00255 [Candidatus Magasanikbacteria bacterium]|nr:hypothetical protein [Candidatus Magasanikbacteria bacterium]